MYNLPLQYIDQINASLTQKIGKKTHVLMNTAVYIPLVTSDKKELLYFYAKTSNNDNTDYYLCSEKDFGQLRRSGYTILHLCCMFNNYESARKVLDLELIHINTINEDGNTALHIACIHNRVNIVKLLLDYNEVNRKQENFEGRTPLYFCMKNKNEKIKKLLLFY